MSASGGECLLTKLTFGSRFTGRCSLPTLMIPTVLEVVGGSPTRNAFPIMAARHADTIPIIVHLDSCTIRLIVYVCRHTSDLVVNFLLAIGTKLCRVGLKY